MESKGEFLCLRRRVTQLLDDTPLPGFPDKYKVLQLLLLALLSALEWCDFTNSRFARGDVICRFRRANTQRGDFGMQMFFKGRHYLIL